MFAVVHIPEFQLQAILRHEPELQEAPVALVQGDSARSLVWQVTSAARKHGVTLGLTSSQAKGRCDLIQFRSRSISQEEAAQGILLECAYLSAAFIESTAPGICTLDLRGLPLIRASTQETALESWASQLRTRLAQLNLKAQIGIASTPAFALQAAQAGTDYSHVTNPQEFWRKLSLQGLAASQELLDILAKWGIQTVGQFLSLGKAQIAERLGAEGIELFNLAKADVIRPLRLVTPSRKYEEFFEFEQRVETLDPLLFIVRRLLEQLARRVEQASLTISEIGLRLPLESGQLYESEVKIAAPTREVNTLFRILHNHLETVRTAAPVVAIWLRAIPCEIETQQFQLFETAVRDPNRFYETIGRLGALLGKDRVGVPVLQNSYRPDDFIIVQPSPNQFVEGKKENDLLPPSGKGVHLSKRGPVLRRFRLPLSAKVRLREGAPIFVESAGPKGSIIQSRGPWRSSGNWWENLWAREEWDVELKDGGLYRIFLETNQWFIDGAYD